LRLVVQWSELFVLQELDGQIDSLRESLRLSETLSDEHNRHLEERSAAARRDAGVIGVTLASLEADRARTARGLPEMLLRLYEKLRAGRTLRPWVIGLTAGHCPACNVALPSALAYEARRTQDPTPCPRCHRLLIWRGAPPPPASAPSGT
jgi:predicted  nucleic acid-binding Zn-ribbon protein